MILSFIRQAFFAVKTPRTKLALIVRGDLKMSKGKTAAQCSHAAIMCYQTSLNTPSKTGTVEAWCFTGQTKVVLRIDSLNDMLQLQRAANEIDVVAEIVRDAGRTQLESGTATVIGIGPDTAVKVDKLVAHLKLL